MRNLLKQAILPAIALSMMFIVPAGAAVESPGGIAPQPPALPSEMAFQIPANNYCSTEDSHDFSFQLSNAGNTAADITMHLYMQDGTEFTSEGSSYRDIGSTIVPGQPTVLKPHATGVYHINFGNHKTCAERVYLGSIAVNSGQASLLAQGWVNTNGRVETIGVNDSRKFELAVPQAKTDAPAAEAPAASEASEAKQ